MASKRPSLSVAVIGIGAAYLIKVIRRLLNPCLLDGQDVPWAKGWLPILGHILTLKKYMKDNNKLAGGRLALGVKNKEGLDLFRIEAMGMEMTCVTEVDIIEEIVTHDPERFTKNFDQVPAFKLIQELFGNGLFFANTDSENWTIPHNIMKAPFSTKGVRTLLPLMCEQADLLVKCLKKEVGHGGVCHIDHWVTKMAFETISVCATGTSFGSFDDDQDSPFVKSLNAVLAGFGPMMKCPSKLWPIFFRKELAKIRSDGKIMRDTCIEVIRRRRMKETHTASAKKDIMDMMLEDKDPKTGNTMTEEQIVDNVLTFLFAGQDSTAAAMGTLLCFLNANPRSKEQLIKEIDTVVGTGQLEWEHLSQMKYLDWCIKEAMRLVPPAAAIARCARGDQLLQNKWRVRGGSMLMIGIMAVHYDKKLWGEDAYEFRPERWENGPPHKFAFIPFAHGPRACIGREFTVIEQKITFVKLLQHFDFRRPDNVKAEQGYTTLKKSDQTEVPFIDMDIEYKTMSAFVGLFSAFELLERQR